MFHLKTRTLTMSVLAGTLLIAGSAHADAGDDCAKGIAKSMSTCVKKVSTQLGNCLKKTGAICLEGDDKVDGATQKLGDGVRKACVNDAAVTDAGYGPFTRLNIATHFQSLCVLQAQTVADHAFGTGGARYLGATDDDKKCLLSAAKSATKLLSGGLGAISKCVEDGCTFDFTELETKASDSIAKKCPNLNALVGQTSAEYAGVTSDQILDAIKSPCDPLDTTRCAFPFPNDYFTTGGANSPTGRHVALGPKTITALDNGISIRPERWNETDGWSVGPLFLFQDTNIDLTQSAAPPITDLAQSIATNSSVVLIDAETGAKQLLWVERDQRGAAITDQPILVSVAKNLKENHRYILAIRNMKDSMGAAVAAPAAFALYRDNTPTDVLPVEARRAHMEDIFTILTNAGIARNELYLAWDITTQSEEGVSSRLLHMRDDATTILGAAAPSFTVDTITPNPATGILRYVDGTFQVPKYLEADNQTLRAGADLVPDNAGDFYTANYRCIIPESAATGGGAPAIPARISLYGHGLLGSHTEVSGGNVRAMANEHNFIFCATDWAGFSEDDVLYAAQALTDWSYFPEFIDKQHQGMLNMMWLGKLMKHANGFSANAAFQVGGQSMLDTSNLFYDGNSQGGILGQVLAAFEQDLTRLVVGVPGINYSVLLHRSVDFSEYESVLIDSYGFSTDRNLLLSLAQNIWDRTDPNGHVNHITSDNYAGTPAKTLLYQVAFGDHQVAPVMAEVSARSTGASIYTPTLNSYKEVPEVTPYYDIPAIPSFPFSGSALVIWDSGNPAPPTGNVPPDTLDPNALTCSGGSNAGDTCTTNGDCDIPFICAALEACTNDTTGDPHSCPRSDPDARNQKSAFLQAGGSVIDVCSGAPCLAQ